MEQKNSIGVIVAGLLLALGIAGGAWALGQAVKDFKAMDRYVSVKGFAEREYPADLAIWPISYSTQANNLQELHSKLQAADKTILQFIREHGLGDAEITPAAPQITENMPMGNRQPEARYSAQGVITVRSEDIKKIKETMPLSGELVSKGIMLIRNYEFQPRFMFTRLNEVKPEMIAEATKDARRAAKQFAEDSDSSVGSIRSARQGVFSIRDRDQYTPEVKIVRVVNTIDYFLEN
ncbi:SIMPL domain-containing protein [Salidesulfovibrio onnuriiensis]|uniref:SIMPL domain-containing protein n=1 Tax=Salidesulfovibrio onnuriiensis TaxID=2583823 RepID=UPI0011CA416E|nr:SIMPL domain-containing protein [Salidesulfovibrio onnuriiensis]